jgi:hypothetical protein
MRRDRIQPGARSLAVITEALPRRKRLREGLRRQIRGRLAIQRTPRKEREQTLSMLAVQGDERLDIGKRRFVHGGHP